MNLLKRFIRNDNAEMDDDYEEEMYRMPSDLQDEMGDSGSENDVSILDRPERKDPEIHPVAPEKVSVKLFQPKSHTEAVNIADKLKSGCIVLLDVSRLTKDQAHRMVDFLAGVAYVIGGLMIKTNPSTIVVSPAGVDISSFAQEEMGGEIPEEVAEESYEEVTEDTELTDGEVAAEEA